MQTLKKYVPHSIRLGLQGFYYSQLRRFFYFPVDALEMLFGKRDELIPPRGRIFIGKGDFGKIGRMYVKYFIEHCDLKPDERVLDVGCGIGRIAIPLTDYLSERGAQYRGFDIVDHGIDWCKKNISSRFPNFLFQRADIYNKAYNPRGKYRASEYKFPYGDEAFDFVFLASVFTHMLLKDTRNYLSEVSRVLRPGGRCLATFFLVDTEQVKLIETGSTSIAFEHRIGRCLTINKDRPEDAVAYDEMLVRELYAQCNLKIVEPVRYGWWRGENNTITIQDVIIAVKSD